MRTNRGEERVPREMFDQFTMAAFCTVGAFVLYILNRTNGKKPFSMFLVINIDVGATTGKPYVILLDMIVSSMIGGSVVYFVTYPSTAAQAVVAGLGMTGLLSVHAKDA